MKGKQKTIFMTGATGLLGHFVLRELLLGGCRVVAMVRRPLLNSQSRLDQLLRQVDSDIDRYLADDRLILIEGDLPHGLPEPTWGSTDEVLSCAASLQLFSNGNQEPHRTNVEGTRRLLDWTTAQGVSRFHAVSTAYVCGSYIDGVAEVFHDPQPAFKTEYERSKWLGEALLAEWGRRPGRVLTVYRPSFLVGHSETGYTTQYGGFYQLARIISILKSEFSNGDGDETTYVPLRIPGSPEAPQNFVPVDFAAQLVAAVVADERLHGRIYHLTDPAPPTNEHVKRCLEEYFNIRGGYFVDPAKANGSRTAAEQLLWEGYDIITPRVTHNPIFRQDNTLEVMQALGLRFPDFSKRRVFTLLDYAVAQHWGQRAVRVLV